LPNYAQASREDQVATDGRLATTFNLPNGVGLGGVRVSIEEALIEMYLTGV
jgi:hypothetical protein